MSIKIGGIDLATTAIDSEFRILVLEALLEKVINKMGGVAIITPDELEQIRSNAFDALQKKYPDAGIKRNK